MKDVLRAEIWKAINGAKISDSLFAEIEKKYGIDKAAALKKLLHSQKDSYLFLGKSFDREIPKKYHLDADDVALMSMFAAIKKVELLTGLESTEFTPLKDYAKALLYNIQILDNRDKLGNTRQGIKVEEYAEALDNADVRLRIAEGFLVDSLDQAKTEVVIAAMEIFALFIDYVFDEERLKKVFDKTQAALKRQA